MKRIFFLVSSIIQLTSVSAQDAHYWTEQFGNKSMLLSGAVIGSVDDLGAVFYNPARLILQEDASFLVSAKAYQNVTLKVKNGLGKQDLSNENFGPAPSLVAGNFTLKNVKWLKKLHNHRFSYAFMSRYNFEYNFGATANEIYEFHPLWPGEENLFASVNWNKSIKEEWVGLSWAIPLNEKWSVGITNFIATSNQSARFELDLQGLGYNDSLVVSTKRRIKNFNTVSYLAKLGVNYSSEKLSMGLTVTTPRAQINGSGYAEYEEVFAGVDQYARSIFELNRSSTDEVKTKSPLSVGIGAGLKMGPTILHFSAEWFGKVDEYYTFVPEPFTGQTTGTVIRNRSIDERKSIINYGVGLEVKIHDKLEAYASIATDLSSLIKNSNEVSDEVNDRQDNSIMTMDLYDYGGGIAVKLKKVDITLGAIYSRGSQPIDRPISFPTDEDDDFIQTDQVNLVWERMRILVGFSVPFYSFGGEKKVVVPVDKSVKKEKKKATG